MPAHVRIHAAQLYTDLGRLADDGATVVDLLADVYNTLLEQAKAGFPTDKMVGTLKPVGEGLHPRVLQALTGQLTLVLGGFGE